MTPKKSDNGFDGLVAIQLCTKCWPGIVNLTTKDLGLEDKEVPDFYHLGNKKLYPAEWRQAFNRKVSEARRFLNDNTFDFVLEWVRCSPKGRMAKTIERLDQFKVEYLALADEFCEKYDSIREDWKAFCELKWPGSWEKMAPHYPANSRSCGANSICSGPSPRSRRPSPRPKPAARKSWRLTARAKAELESKCKEAVEAAFLDYQKRILEVVSGLSISLKEGKVIRNESLEKVRNLHDWAQEMNIFGYKPIEEELAKLKAGLDGVDIKALKDNDAAQEAVGRPGGPGGSGSLQGGGRDHGLESIAG